jgi:hypothetical protein
VRLVFRVEIELERTEGKFASKDELAESIASELEGVNPGEVYGENEGVYAITDWVVERLS